MQTNLASFRTSSRIESTLRLVFLSGVCIKCMHEKRIKLWLLRHPLPRHPLLCPPPPPNLPTFFPPRSNTSIKMSMGPEEFFAGLESRVQDLKADAKRASARAQLEEREEVLKGE